MESPSFPIDPKVFLEEIWQKRPLRLPKLLPEAGDLLTGEEVAGLCLEESLTSRLILPSEEGPRVEDGPFSEGRLAGLEGPFSLFVQAVDRIFESVRALREPFSFLPSWREDDIMVSYSPEGGGVGPHWDRYDVFLVQGMGKRRWRYGGEVKGAASLVREGDLALLRDHSFEEEWLMEPGDVLYIPPGVAHEGVSLAPSVTFSLGYRAPRLCDVFYQLAEALPEELLFSDPERTPNKNSELTKEDVALLTQKLKACLDEHPDIVTRALGLAATLPRYPLEPSNQESFSELWFHRGRLLRAPGLKIARTDDAIYIEGLRFSWPSVARDLFFELLTSANGVPIEKLRACYTGQDQGLIQELFEQGFIEVFEAEDALS